MSSVVNVDPHDCFDSVEELIRFVLGEGVDTDHINFFVIFDFNDGDGFERSLDLMFDPDFL